MRPRWHKVVRDILGNKTRTALVVLSIAVGVFAVGAILTARLVLQRDLAENYAATNPASAMLALGHPLFGGGDNGLDDEMVAAIRRMREVGAAEGRRRVGMRVQVGPDQWRDLQLIAVSDFNDIRINTITSESGDWPPPEHELLVERGGLGLLNVGQGGSLLVRTADGHERRLRVAGVVHDLAQLPSTIDGWVYGYATFETLEWLGEPREFNELNIVVAEQRDDKAHIQRVADKVRDKIERSGRSVLLTLVYEPGEHLLNDTIQSIVMLLGVLGVLALLLSAALVINTVVALLAQQTRQIGLMKAFGARSRQLVAMYLVMVLCFGLLALLLAVPLGALGAWAFSRFIAGVLNFDLARFRVPPLVLLIQALVGLLVPALAALGPILAGTRVTVHEALTTYGLNAGRFGQSRFDRLLEQVQQLPRPLLLALRNSVRRKLRLALTLGALTLAGTIFISVMSVQQSLMLTLDDLLHFWGWDAWVTLNRPYRSDLLEQQALLVPGVVEARGIGIITTRRVRDDDSESDAILFFGPPADSDLVRPELLHGRWLLPTDQQAVVVTTDLLKTEPDLDVGDLVVFKIAGRETDWRVVGIARGLPAPLAFANEPGFAQATREVGRSRGIWLVTAGHDAAAQRATAQALERHFRHLGIQISSLTLVADERAETEAAFGVLVALLVIMATLLALVGGLGLMGTLSLNVVERTREIGVMRAIGASNGVLLRMVFFEGLLIALTSWLLALPLAWPLSLLICNALGQVFLNAPLSYAFSWSGTLIWLAAVVVLAAAASLLPAWNAARVSVAEALAYA